MNLTTNELKVKFKNAAMQVWTQVKKEQMPKDMQTLIFEMIQRRNKKNEWLAKLGVMQA